MNIFKDPKDRKSLYIIIMIISLVLTLTGISNSISFISLLIFVLVVAIIDPLNDKIIDGTLKEKATIIEFVIKTIIFIVFAITYYIIYIGRNYNLKYTYFVALGILIFTVLSVFYEGISDYIKGRKDKKEKKKTLSFVFTIVFQILLIVYFSYTGIAKLALPLREITLEDLKYPNVITVNKMTNESYEDESGFISQIKSTDIDDSEDIEKIMEELESQKPHNISGVDLLNYYRRTDDYEDQYFIFLDYGSLNIAEDTLEKGYINYITISSDGRVFIEDRIKRDGLLYKDKMYDDILPVDLSRDTLEMIRSYAK